MREDSSSERLKIEHQNSLDVSTLDNLMNIIIIGPIPQDFLAERAIIHWLQDVQRASRSSYVR